MLQPCQKPSFLQKLLLQRVACVMIRIEGERLQGIVRPELQMLDLLHRTHSALPERTHNPVVADYASFFKFDHLFHLT